VRKGKAGGIDWFRYYKEIMLNLMIPFAQKCQKKRPDTLIQEDGAPAHAYHHQGPVYALFGTPRLVWPGNSPDLNAIEPAWPWMKITTTIRGAPTARKEMEKAWHRAWKDLPQDKIRAWIERIPIHIQEIIRLEGGNEYPEGRKAFKRDQKGQRIKGILSKHSYLPPLQHHDDVISDEAVPMGIWEDFESESEAGQSDETDSD